MNDYSAGAPVHEEGQTRRVLVPVLATLVLIIVGSVATLGITYWVMARRFLAGDAHAGMHVTWWRDGLPPVIDKGHDLLQRFAGCHGTTLCREVRGTDRLPLRCVGAVRQAPELCAQTLSSDCAGVIPAPSRDAYRRLYTHLVEKQFHCAHAVLQQVGHMNPLRQDVLDATTPFIGGTVLTGMTCSALTAGVMALGVALGEVERSRLVCCE
jgi:Putative redox-active protein (C_GCAxxG_C_C)